MIQNLRLQNFRSYIDTTFNFSPLTNIIVGPNAVGKTNILEAILVSRIGASYRARDIDLITFKKPWSRLDSLDDKNPRIVKIERDQNPAKTIDINSHIYKRLPASMKLPVVLFEPNHLQLLNGSPDGRRAYLDGFIEQIEEEYAPMLRMYLRALAQRNRLLKSTPSPSANQLFPWNIRLSQLGGQIVKYRNQTIKLLNSTLPTIYSSVSKDKLKTQLIYQPQFAPEGYESNYLKTLEKNITEDLRIGFTLYGPHRDDFTLTFNNHPSSTYASRGELRTAILALKITEFETIKSRAELSPIFLLDDVYSELDNQRRKSLTNYLKADQSFITTTDADLARTGNQKNKVIKL